jgi:Ca-activated chloride channel homolog
MRVAARLLLAASLAAALPASASAQARPEDPTAEQPVFRTSVEIVAMAAVVRNKQGRVVPTLSRDDFEVLDAGGRRPIVDLRTEIGAPASVALLVDSSGSMKVGHALDSARLVASEVLDRLDPTRDEAALLTFDSRLVELMPFTRDYDPVRMRLEDLDAYGTTSLYDAIAQAARTVAPNTKRRRAIVVLTDGADNSSAMTPAEVSAVASSIDVPVYILSVGAARTEGPLSDLARWTGGDFFLANTAAQASAGIRQLIDELRHQYVIAFEPSIASGWRHVEIRTRRPGLTVRARSWYLAGNY